MGNILLQKELYIFLCFGILKLLSCQKTSFTFHIISLSVLIVAVQIRNSSPSSSITKNLIEGFPWWKMETHFLFLSHFFFFLGPYVPAFTSSALLFSKGSASTLFFNSLSEEMLMMQTPMCHRRASP